MHGGRGKITLNNSASWQNSYTPFTASGLTFSFQMLPAAANDVDFSTHAVIFTVILLVQIAIFESAKLSIFMITLGIIFAVWITVAVCFLKGLPKHTIQGILAMLKQENKDRGQSEILGIPEDDWREWGENSEKLFGEGCSSSMLGSNEDVTFRVYFKGLVSEETVGGEKTVLAGIGIAICDPRDNLIFEVRKPLAVVGNGMSKNAAEAKALIEALNAAVALDLKRITYYSDCYPLYQIVSRKWTAEQRQIRMLVNQVTLLEREFTYCNPKLVARHDVKFAYKLAKDAISSQIIKPAESSCRKHQNEICVICLEDTDVSHIFSVDGCRHRYCFSCMKHHVEVKLLDGIVPKCPHEGCNSELLIDSCRKFLTHKLIETMQQRIKEVSIPVSEKIYCPYPRCSALMSKAEVLEYSKRILGESEQSGPKKCVKCHSLFCFSCKVPWHSGMTCSTYKRLNPNPPAEDVKLKSLATRSLWRQCVKCNHMIELAEGCYHMTCRCGYEFCYNCGAQWKNKKATCSCPLWDEDNILLEDHERDPEEMVEDDDGSDGLDHMHIHHERDSDEEVEYDDDIYDSDDSDGGDHIHICINDSDDSDVGGNIHICINYE